MDWEGLSTDELEQQLVARERVKGRLASEQLEILEVLDVRQTATGDGSRSLAEWVSARLDVGLGTAQSLVRTMRRTGQRPDLREALACGVASLDRIEAVSRISDDVGLMEAWDVAAVRAEAARRTRITVSEEQKSRADRFLVVQSSLDESWWRLWGGLDGYSGAIVDKVLSEAGRPASSAA